MLFRTANSIPSFGTILKIAPLALVLGVTTVSLTTATVNAQEKKDEKTQTQPDAKWSAAAPGRVEPNGGIIGLNPALLGRVAKVLVRVGDKVVKDQPLVILDDEELLSKLRASEANVEVRKKNRSTSGNTKIKQRRDAEDDFETAEDELHEARRVLEEISENWFSGSAKVAELSTASNRVAEAQKRFIEARNILRSVRDDQNAASPTNGELALTSARSNRGLAIAALNRSRIRAPKDGTVLDVNVKIGETVGPQAPQPLIMIGDLSSLRIKAELDARDVAEVRVGQEVLVRADAFDGKDFKGKVKSIGHVLKPARLGGLGTQRPANSRVLEVMVDLQGGTPLISGMEVDVLFLSEAKSAKKKPRNKTAKNTN